MRFRFTPEQAALQQEIRAYFTELMTPELREELRGTEGVGPVPRKVALKMGADGWLGVGWPKEFGGRGLTPVEQFIFFDESMAFGAPVPVLSVNSVAPTIMQFGSEEQKQFFLPKILAGEIHFAIGYTEPDHGTDLAALETRAVRDGDEYVINGTKIFTSLASDADYIWLACRTDPEAPRHKGISMIIVPTDTPGFSYTPIDSIGSFNTNYTFYEDVRVPVSNLVGPEHGGWGLITNQLNHERVTICSSGIIERRYRDLLAWAKETTTAEGERIIDLPWVQRNLAHIRAHHEFLRLANYEIAFKAERGDPLNPADASVVKVYGSELYMEAYDLMLEIVGAAAGVEDGSPGAVLRGQLQGDIRSQHVLTFGGGTNEMQRGLIAVFALGMPGSPR